MPISSSDRLAPASLYTVNCDPRGQVLRWALCMHGVPYVNKLRPWHGSSAMAVMHTSKGETITGFMEILIYVFAHSWSAGGSVRLFPSKETNELIERLDDAKLFKSVECIYLASLLSKRGKESLMYEGLPLPKHQSTLRLLLPVIRLAFYPSKRTIRESWDHIEKAFADLESSVPSKLTGTYCEFLNHEKVLSAADLLLAAFVAVTVFPDESQASGIELAIPELSRSGLEDVIPDFYQRVKTLRRGVTSRYGLSVLQNQCKLVHQHKGKIIMEEAGRFSRHHGSPAWSEYRVLRASAVSGALYTAILLCAVIVLHGTFWFCVLALVLAACGYASFAWAQEHWRSFILNIG
ncbi:MAG: hypothetical protein SGCHY_001872 [Lobulomycetales sp.]